MKEKIISGLIILPIYFVIFMILSMCNIYLFEGPWYISIPIIVIFPLIGVILTLINYSKKINYRTLFMMIFFFIMGLIFYYKTYTLDPNYDAIGFYLLFIIFAILYRISTVVFCYKLFKNNIVYSIIIYMFIAIFVIICSMIMGR